MQRVCQVRPGKGWGGPEKGTPGGTFFLWVTCLHGSKNILPSLTIFRQCAYCLQYKPADYFRRTDGRKQKYTTTKICKSCASIRYKHPKYAYWKKSSGKTTRHWQGKANKFWREQSYWIHSKNYEQWWVLFLALNNELLTQVRAFFFRNQFFKKAEYLKNMHKKTSPGA